jgi:hypothetical protein
MGRGCSMHGERRNAYRGLVRKLQGKRPVERHKCRCEGNIWVGLREIGWRGMD